MAESDGLVDAVGPQFRLVYVPMLVFFMLKYKENGTELCLRLLQMFRGKTWIYLIASKLHEKFLKYGILSGKMFEEGEMAYFSARRTLLWDYYNVIAVTVGLLYSYRSIPEDRELRLRILRYLICAQVAYICLGIDMVVVSFQVIFLVWLMSLYVQELNPSNFSVAVEAFVQEAGIGLLYAVLIAIIFGAVLLGMAAGNPSPGVEAS